VIRKKYEGKLAVSLISSQLDADRMDYLLRDAYFTGVNYGMFDLERILRVMRPHKGHIVVKDSGMHAVEDYLMSRYQMYWQVYFHPVTRGSEILLRNILRRASTLYRNGYRFGFILPPLPAWFENRLDIREFLQLDESLVQTVLARWMDERDKVLSDLCARFIHRRLFKYAVLSDEETLDAESVRQKLADAGYDPDYYLEIDLIGKLPYDVYRPGETGENIPILLLDGHGRLSEISTRSQIVRSLGDSTVPGGAHVYYPGDVPGLERIWKGDHHAV
jgi:HD superfamily phosphohydrolase